MRFFTWEEIRQGQVPTMPSFGQVVELCRQEISALPGSVGAILCGSCLTDSAERWSDIDLVVGFKKENSGEHRETTRRLQALTRRAADIHVPLAIVPVDLEMARYGTHAISIGFYKHLCWAAEHGGLMGRNPLPDISVQDTRESRRHEAWLYVIRSLDQLMKSEVRITDDVAEANHWRSRIVDKPFHAVRRTCELRDSNLPPLTRKGLVDAYASFASAEESQRLQQLYSFLSGYRELLEELSDLSGKDRWAHKNRYQRALREVDELANVAIQILHDLYRYI